MYWTLELASYLSDAPWPATKDELIDYVYDCKKKDPIGVSLSNRGGWQSEGFEIIDEDDDGEFDDFNEDKNFNRVLFKPGIPVQARELTQLQTILQNQIEKFGQHFFKEGSMVIPGQIGYDSLYHAIELEDTFLGIPISEYLDKLVGKTIRGEISGVEATVVNYILSTQSERGHNTLYVKYSKSGNDFATNVFNDGENLITSSDIEYGISRIISNNPFATAIALNATSIGSAATVQEGVYFIRGYFVKVTSQTIIVDQYSDVPSYRVGLQVLEEIVTPEDDSTLNDPSQGYSNYSAPGAHRLKFRAVLVKKALDDTTIIDFIELLKLEEGKCQEIVSTSKAQIAATLEDTLARRTFDESGDYEVTPYEFSTQECLDDGNNNGGLQTPDIRDLMLLLEQKANSSDMEVLLSNKVDRIELTVIDVYIMLKCPMSQTSLVINLQFGRIQDEMEN